MDSSKPEPRSTNFDSDAEDGEISSSPKQAKQISTEAVPSDVMKGTETDYGDFVIDRTESLATDSQEDSSADSSQLSACSAWMVSTTAGLLDDVDFVEKKEAPEPPTKRHRNACFNCDGPHNLHDCKEPRDQKRIRERQAEMKERRRTLDSARYHDEEQKAGEAEYAPGKISRELREALGIGSDDIPEWIYRMRKLGFLKGYPPAYLRQAIVSKDRPGEVLKFHLIDKDRNGEFNKEDGEEEEDTPPPVIDSNKIIYYLGFNKTYRNLRDREHRFRIPPFEEFVRFHQDEVVRKWQAETANRKKEIEKRKRRAKEMQDERDIVVLDSTSADEDDCIVIDCEPTKLSESEPERCETPQEPSSSVVPKTPQGTVVETISGTPVLFRKNAEGQHLHNALPSLDAFSKGITPFSAVEEPNPHRGFLRSIVAKIKQVTGKK